MWRIRLYQLIVLGVFLGGWEWVSDRHIRTLWISKPSLIAERTLDWFSSGFIYSHILATLQIAGLGLLIGTAIGVVFGIAFGLQRSLSRLLDPILGGAYTLPRIAFLPVLLFWFGFGFRPLVALVVLMIFFVLFYNTRAGVESVRRRPGCKYARHGGDAPPGDPNGDTAVNRSLRPGGDDDCGTVCAGRRDRWRDLHR